MSESGHGEYDGYNAYGGYGRSAEYFEARIRVESGDWTFGAHQAAARAAAAEQLVQLRRQYRHQSEKDLARLAESWRPDDASGPYFVFAAAALGGAGDPVAIDAMFLRALIYELLAEAPAALAGLLGLWDDQRRYAWESGQQPDDVRPPRIVVQLPRDPRRWASGAWDLFAGLDLEDPDFDGSLLTWDYAAGCWMAAPSAAGETR